jgi:uncharacterized membrane protein YgdD (TMEM256/DUF423 family)
MNVPSIRQPLVFLPLAMSLAALLVLLGHFAVYGLAHESDEGTAAHLFQLLMLAQLPLIASLAIQQLPQFPRQTLRWLGMQIAAALAAMVAVLFLT